MELIEATIEQIRIDDRADFKIQLKAKFYHFGQTRFRENCPGNWQTEETDNEVRPLRRFTG